MGNDYFQFKKFIVRQGDAAMKVTTDSCLFGAWCASEITQLRKVNSSHSTEKLLDIGTGTGLLSMMVAQKNELSITAIEVEKNAALQARSNVEGSPFAGNTEIVEGDILDFPGTGYDYIISNPPFYENELQSPEKVRNIAHHSHLLKWEQLFTLIASKLNQSGQAFLLLPASRNVFANELIARAGLFINKEILVLQSQGRSPFRRMIRISGKESALQVNELCIRDEKGDYTEVFQSYLKDYYLHL